MQWYWCYLVNNTPSFVRVVVISQYGQGTYFQEPVQNQWVQWYLGQKVMTVFDGATGQYYTSYPFYVSGPGQYSVMGGSPAGGGGSVPYSVSLSPAPANVPSAAHGASH